MKFEAKDTFADREEKRQKVVQRVKIMKSGLSNDTKAIFLEEIHQILRLLRFDDMLQLLPVFGTFLDEPK